MGCQVRTTWLETPCLREQQVFPKEATWSGLIGGRPPVAGDSLNLAGWSSHLPTLKQSGKTQVPNTYSFRPYLEQPPIKSTTEDWSRDLFRSLDESTHPVCHSEPPSTASLDGSLCLYPTTDQIGFSRLCHGDYFHFHKLTSQFEPSIKALRPRPMSRALCHARSVDLDQRHFSFSTLSSPHSSWLSRRSISRLEKKGRGERGDHDRATGHPANVRTDRALPSVTKYQKKKNFIIL